MTEHFRFFDAQLNSLGRPDREYNGEEFTDYFKALVTTGLFKGKGGQLKVSTNGANMLTTIDTGIAFIEGKYYEYDGVGVLNHTHDTETLGRNRIDRVVIRMDENTDARYVKSFVKKGVASTSPVAPTLTQTPDVYEISLAQVKVIGGQTYINIADVVDERGTDVICPYAGSNILPNFNAEGLADLVEIVEGIHQLVTPTTGTAIPLTTDSDLDSIIGSGFYRVGFNASPKSGLPAGTYMVLVVRNNISAPANGSVTQIIVAENGVSGTIFTRTRNAVGVWSDVKEFVTSKLPAWTNVVLGAGWVLAAANPVRYYKDAFGIVHLTGRAIRSTGSSSAIPITILPVGFRPMHVHSTNAIENADHIRTVQIGIDGRVMDNRTETTVDFVFDTSFRTI